jgi:hypothetical protein
MALTADDYQVQLTINSKSNVAEDAAINTFAVKAMSGGATFSDIRDAVDTFFDEVDHLMSNSVNSTAGAHKIRVYHLTDPKPRPPVYEDSFTTPSVGGTALPSEVALCLSFAGAPMAGVSPARRRGRIYFGPLAATIGDLQSNQFRPTTGAIALVSSHFQALIEDLAAADWQFCVWSRVDNVLVPVTHGWTNNEFDTMRSRGIQVTGRYTWSL